MVRYVVAVVFAVGSVACSGPATDEPRSPGDWLGSYAVVGTLEESSCGEGALGSPDIWKFDVQLSSADFELFWMNGREAISGQLASDRRTFSFSTAISVALSEARPGLAGCTVRRADRAKGLLSHSGPDVPAFEADLTFAYAAESTSECGDYVGVPGGFAMLPCEMNYHLVGTRRPEK